MGHEKLNYKHILFSGLGLIVLTVSVYLMVTTLANISEKERETNKPQEEQVNKDGENQKDEDDGFVTNIDEEQYLETARENLKEDPNYRYTVSMPDYIREVQNTTGDLFVYYYSPICKHCIEATPSVIKGLDSAKGMVGDEFKFSQVDVTINPDIYYPLTEIKGTPTLVKYTDGVEVFRVSGSGYPDTFYTDIFDNNEQINEYVDLEFKDYNLREQVSNTEFVDEDVLQKIIEENETETSTDVD